MAEGVAPVVAVVVAVVVARVLPVLPHPSKPKTASRSCPSFGPLLVLA